MILNSDSNVNVLMNMKQAIKKSTFTLTTEGGVKKIEVKMINETALLIILQ